MKKYLFLLFAAFFSIIVSAQSNFKDPYLTRSLSNESIKNITLETIGGNISVIADGSEARLEVYVQPNDGKNSSLSKDELKKRLEEEYDLTISVISNELRGISKPRTKNLDWRKALNISFKAFVTVNVSTELTTSGGNITLKGISGRQNFSTSGGNLSIESTGGKVKGTTSGGNLYVSNTKDEVDLSTSGGNVLAENCSGNIKLSTSGGSLNLSNLKGNINATTSGGNVRGNNIEGELFTNTSGGSVILKEISCSLTTATSGGNIDVAVKEFGRYIKIDNSAGSIALTIPKNKGADLKLSAYKIKTEALENFSGTKEDDTVRGKLNGGGTPVTVSAGSGNIYLSFK